MRLLRRPDEAQLGQVVFDATPAYDLFLSLLALAGTTDMVVPTGWADATRSLLPAAAQADLDFFCGGDEPLILAGLRLLRSVPPSKTVAATLAYVESLPAERLATILLSTQEEGRGPWLALYERAMRHDLQPIEQATLDQHIAEFPEGARQRVGQCLSNPSSVRDRFVGLLRVYAERCFLREEPVIKRGLHTAVESGTHLIDELPVSKVVLRLTGGLRLPEPVPYPHIILVPSCYISPNLLTDPSGSDLVIVYGVGWPSALPVSRSHEPEIDVLLPVFKALGDESRLRTLWLLSERPMYAQELADALDLRHPTVLHHLMQLRNAGLVTVDLREAGKYYSPTPERAADALRTLLERLNRQPQPAPPVSLAEAASTIAPEHKPERVGRPRGRRRTAV